MGRLHDTACGLAGMGCPRGRGWKLEEFTGPGASPADPGVLDVSHAKGPAAPYTVIKTCLGYGAMPLGETSCLDQSASRTEDGGVVMVVRTTTTSRWIIR